MNNLLTYLDWRGDIVFAERPFNEVDNLILAEFSYMDFSGIVPNVGAAASVTIAQAYAAALRQGWGARAKALSSTNYYQDLWEKLAKSKRYGSARLSNYSDIYDHERQLQFAALHITLADETTYIAFRGTDQTICGWREDFAMSFQIVQSQVEAVRYVEKTMAPGVRYRLGGHSKGGNLAVYAAAMCKHKEQIAQIYNNDGPGFSPELMQTREFQMVREKICRIIPQYSVIGMLFENSPPTLIVKSSADGLLQHSGTTWLVSGDGFELADDLLPKCKATNQMIDDWMEDVSMEERQVFVKEFFDALEASGSQNVDEVAKRGAGGFEAVLTALVDSEKDTKSVIAKLIKSSFKRLRKVNILALLRTQNLYKGLLMLVLGIFITKLPAYAVQIIATCGLGVLVFFAVRRLVIHIQHMGKWTNTSKYSIAVYSAVIAIIILLILQKSVLYFSVNFALGALCCFYGYTNLKKGIVIREKRNTQKWVSLARALLSTLLGLVVILSLGQAIEAYAFVIGTFMIIDGVVDIVTGTYRKMRYGVA